MGRSILIKAPPTPPPLPAADLAPSLRELGLGSDGGRCALALGNGSCFAAHQWGEGGMALGGCGSCLEGSGGVGTLKVGSAGGVPEELRPHSHSRAAPALPSDLSREREDWYPLTALIPPHPL